MSTGLEAIPELVSKLPAWALEGLVGLAVAIGKLTHAEDDAAREAALMEAAESTKAALDKKKFG